MKDFLGYLRDFVAAVLGLMLIFGWLNEEAVGGILLVVTTAAAFGMYLWVTLRRT